MARCRRSFVSFLCLSFILFSLGGAHPNARTLERRQSLELSIEQWEDTASTLNSTVSTDSLEKDIVNLPKSLKDFLQLLSLGLKLFGDALASLVQDRIVPGTTTASALLMDVPSLATLIPLVSTHSWVNTSRPAVATSSRTNSTSYVTLTSTRLRTVTASRSRSAALAIATDVSAPSMLPSPLTQSALPFEKRNIVQVYAGRYPGIARTIADLEALCADPDIDIITLAGITSYFSPTASQPIPTADFDALCADTLTLTPTGESECAALAGALHTCQTSQGKTLFLAVETGTESATLRSAREATTFANYLWDIYGAGKAADSGARYYGSPPRNSLGIAFDGFEFLVNTTTIDDEYFAAVTKAKRDSSIFVPPTLPYFDVLFAELRELFTTSDGGKPYYLSVSLPCTRPSILSRSALNLADFVSVRFMNDIACNVNGVAFSNFLTVWGKDVADRTAVDRVGTEAESTLTRTTTSLRTTTLRSLPAPGPTEAFRLINPARFSIERYTTLPTPDSSLEISPWSLPKKDKRQQQLLHTPPHFLLGIPVPSQETQNATSISGMGSADPATLAGIIEHARYMLPGFVGLLLWGGVEDMEVGEESGYLNFVKGVLDGKGAVVPPMVASPAVEQSKRVSTHVSSAMWTSRVTEVPSPVASLSSVESSAAATVASEPMFHILPHVEPTTTTAATSEPIFHILPHFDPTSSGEGILVTTLSMLASATLSASIEATVSAPVLLSLPGVASGSPSVVVVLSTRLLTKTITRSRSSVVVEPTEAATQ